MLSTCVSGVCKILLGEKRSQERMFKKLHSVPQAKAQEEIDSKHRPDSRVWFKHLFVFSKIQPKDILDTETKYSCAPICLKSSLFFYAIFMF